jgi:hypothetical protein
MCAVLRHIQNRWRYCDDGVTAGPYYRTVMSYSCSGATRVPYFSSPVITYSGKATGNAGADNAKVLQLTHYTAANFKQGGGGTPTRKFNCVKLTHHFCYI